MLLHFARAVMHRRRVLLLASIVTLACGGDATAPSENGVVTVEVAGPGTTIEVGHTIQLTGSAKDDQQKAIAGATFTWQSANTSVATVSSTGLVTGVGVG